MIKINYNSFSNVFCIPTKVVNEDIKTCGGFELKVLLYVLKNQENFVNFEDIASFLSQSVVDVKDAINFWVNKGILLLDDNVNAKNEADKTKEKTNEISQNICTNEAQNTQKFSEKAEEKIAEICVNKSNNQGFESLTNEMISLRMQNEDNIRVLIESSEEILGRVLSPFITSTLICAVDNFSLPVEVILMLLTYCKNENKTGTKYIQSVISDFSKQEIFSVEKAEEKITYLQKLKSAFHKLSDLLEFKSNRKPSKKEEECANRWFNEYNFSDDVILEAYNKCVDKLHDYNLKYMDEILSTWFNAGIKTGKDAYIYLQNHKKSIIEKNDKSTNSTANKLDKHDKSFERNYNLDAINNKFM